MTAADSHQVGCVVLLAEVAEAPKFAEGWKSRFDASG